MYCAAMVKEICDAVNLPLVRNQRKVRIKTEADPIQLGFAQSCHGIMSVQGRPKLVFFLKMLVTWPACNGLLLKRASVEATKLRSNELHLLVAFIPHIQAKVGADDQSWLAAGSRTVRFPTGHKDWLT